MFGLRYPELLAVTPGVSEELDGFYKRLNAFLLVAHNDDGTLISAAPAQVSALGLPVGAIVPYAGTSAPTGWVWCDGTAYSRATYATLFRAIGTTYGAGDGATTFNVPDLRQRFPLGKGTSGTGATLGSTGGAIDHAHTGPSHTHAITEQAAATTASQSTATSGAASTATTGAPSATTVVQSGAGATVASSDHTHDHAHTHDIVHTHTVPAHDHGAVTGSGGAGTTGTANPPFLSLNYIMVAA